MVLASPLVQLGLDAVRLGQVEQHAASGVSPPPGDEPAMRPDSDYPRLDAEGDSDGWAIQEDRYLVHIMRLPRRRATKDDPEPLPEPTQPPFGRP